jgi:hypothetical protein
LGLVENGLIRVWGGGGVVNIPTVLLCAYNYHSSSMAQLTRVGRTARHRKAVFNKAKLLTHLFESVILNIFFGLISLN